MHRRLHPLTVVLTLAIVFLAIFIIYSHRLERMAPPTPTLARGGLPPPMHDDTLGAMLSPVPRRHATKIMGFRPPPSPSPLRVIGCVPGDILTKCNGEQWDWKKFAQALKDLRENNKPFTLTVERRGQEVDVKVTRWPEPLARPEDQPRRGRAAEPTPPRAGR